MTVGVISSDPPGPDDNVRFTTATLSALSDHAWMWYQYL